MDDAGFILGSYVVTFAVIALFGLITARRGRKLASQVPADEKYWT